MSKLKSGVKSLFDIATNAAKGIDQSVPEEVAKYRLDICNNCPRLFAPTGNCKDCGCFVRAKTKIKQEACPNGYWTEYKETDS